MSWFRKTVHYHFNTQSTATMIGDKLPDILVTMGGMASHSNVSLNDLTQSYAQTEAMSPKLNQYYRYAKVHTPFIRTNWQIDHAKVYSVPTKESILSLLIQDSEALITNFDLNDSLKELTQAKLNVIESPLTQVLFANGNYEDPRIDLYNWFITHYPYKPNSNLIIHFQNKYPFVLETINNQDIQHIYENVQYPQNCLIVGSFINNAENKGLAVLVDPKEDTSKWVSEDKIPFTVVGETPIELLNQTKYSIGYLAIDLQKELATNSNNNLKINVETVRTPVTVASETNLTFNNEDKEAYITLQRKNLIDTLELKLEQFMYYDQLLNKVPTLEQQKPLETAFKFIEQTLSQEVIASFIDFNELQKEATLPQFCNLTEYRKEQTITKGDSQSENEEDLFDNSKEVIITTIPGFYENTLFSIGLKIEKTVIADPTDNTGINKIEVRLFYSKQKENYKPSELPYKVSWIDSSEEHSIYYPFDFKLLRDNEFQRLTKLYEDAAKDPVLPVVTRYKYNDSSSDKLINFHFLGGIIKRYQYKNTLNTSNVNKEYKKVCETPFDPKDDTEDTYGNTAIPGKLDRKDTIKNREASKKIKRSTNRLTARKELYNRKSEYSGWIYPKNKTRYIKDLADKILVDITAQSLEKTDSKVHTSCVIPACPLDTGFQGVGEYWYNFFERLKHVTNTEDQVKELNQNITEAMDEYYNLAFKDAFAPVLKELLEFYSTFDLDTFLRRHRPFMGKNSEYSSFFNSPYYTKAVNNFTTSFLAEKIYPNSNDLFNIISIQLGDYSYLSKNVGTASNPQIIHYKDFTNLSKFTRETRSYGQIDYWKTLSYKHFQKFIQQYYPEVFYLFNNISKRMWVYFPPELILNNLVCSFKINLPINATNLVTVTELMLADDITSEKRFRMLADSSVTPLIREKLMEKIIRNKLSMQTCHTKEDSNSVLNNTIYWDHIAKIRIKGQMRDNYRQSGRQYDILACSIFPEQLTFTEADIDLNQVTLKYHEPTGNTVPISIESDEQYRNPNLVGKTYNRCNKKVLKYPIAFICHKSDEGYLEGYAIWGLKGSIKTPYKGNIDSFYKTQTSSIVKDLDIIYSKNNTRFFGAPQDKKDLKPSYHSIQRSGGKNRSTLNYMSVFTIPLDMKTFNKLNFYTREALVPRIAHAYVWAYQYKKVKKMRGWVSWAVKVVGFVIAAFTYGWGSAVWYTAVAAVLQVTGILDKFFELVFKTFTSIFGNSLIGNLIIVASVVIASYFGYGVQAANVALSYASYNANAQLAAELTKLQSDIENERVSFGKAMKDLMARKDEYEAHSGRGDAKMLMESIKDNQILSADTFYKITLGNIIDFGSGDFLSDFLSGKLQLSLTSGEKLDPEKSTSFKVDTAFI